MQLGTKRRSRSILQSDAGSKPVTNLQTLCVTLHLLPACCILILGDNQQRRSGSCPGPVHVRCGTGVSPSTVASPVSQSSSLLLLPVAELPSWKFWPSQWPLSTSLDPGRWLSSFWSSFGRYPVWCYPPIYAWVFLLSVSLIPQLLFTHSFIRHTRYKSWRSLNTL